MSTWILLRGLTREAGHWGDFPAQLSLAFPDDTIVCLDLPGNGRYYRGHSPCNINAMVDQARRRVAKLGIGEPVKVLALSLGGMVAVEWSRQFPDEFEALVLMNTSMRPFSTPWQRLRPRNYPALIGLIVTKDQRRREQTILHLTSHRYTARNAADLVTQWTLLAEQHPVSRRNALNQLIAAARYRAPTEAPAIPILVLSGGSDQLVNPSCSHAIADVMGAMLRVNPDAGHDLALDAPD